MKLMESKGDVVYNFTASVIDIYMMGYSDLLNNRKPLNLSEDFTFYGMMEMDLKCPADVCKMVATAMSQRMAAGTKMNEQSSRSHAIALVNLSKFNKETGEITETTFSFFDMAGSERVSKTGESK